MPEKQAKIENLISELHELFGDERDSTQQKELLAQLQAHIHDASDSAPVEPTPLESIELLLEEMGESHPKTSAVLRELLDTLKNIGV